MMLHQRKWRWRWRRLLADYVGLIVVLLGCISDGQALSQASFKFTQPAYNVSIPESPDGKAYAVPAVDSERMGIVLTDLSAEIRYKVVSGDKRKIFRPQPRNVGDFCFFSLRTRTSTSSRLNRELDATHELTVEATVKGHPELVALTTVYVTVVDRNDLNPLFYPTRYSVEIDEDVPLHSPILQVAATDADSGLNGDIYYILGEPSPYFAVNLRSGVVSITKRPDVDVQNEFIITVVAQDRGFKSRKLYLGGAESPSNAQVTVQVRRVNRNAPFISVQSVPSALTNTYSNVVGSVEVTDPDYGIHGQIGAVEVFEDENTNRTRLYIADAGTSGHYFIKTADRDRVNARSIRLTVKATDRGVPSKSSSKVVNMSLVSVNNDAPKFDSDKLTLEIPENLPINSFLTQIRAALANGDESDRNSPPVSYSIATKTDTFRINTATGWISLVQPIDRETRNIYELEVMANNDAPQGLRKSATAKITIKITDENDNDPLFESSEAVVGVDENEPAGSIVHVASARDQDEGDNAIISYSLANLNEVPFEVEPHTGRVKLIRRLDYEMDRREYRLLIRAADSGKPYRRETQMTLIIKLQPKNDNAPVFRKFNCTGNAIIRPETRLVTLAAFDPDENDDAVTYKLLNDEDAVKKCFNVNQSSGDVMVMCGDSGSPKDASLPDYITLKFIATDGTFDSTIVWVNVTLSESSDGAKIECQLNPQVGVIAAMQEKSRENNQRIDTFPPTPELMLHNRRTPKFPSDFPAIVHLDEDLQVGSEVLLLDALDEDYGYNSWLQYAAISDGEYFRTTPKGQLLLARPLDRERRLTHNVNITVQDCGDPPKMSSRLLLIRVLDKNDNIPVFEHNGYFFTVTENSPLGSPVGFVKATDIDEGLNGKVMYSLADTRSPFRINSETGAITIAGSIDYEVTQEFRFSALASDNSVDTPRTSSVDCTVFLQDINDNPPRFPSGLIKMSIPEDVPVGSILTFVTAFDKDSGSNGEVQYAIVSENDVATGASWAPPRGQAPFTVDPFTGALSLTEALDFEKVSLFNFSITALDKGQPTLSSTLWVEVHVEDVDENLNPPKFKDYVTSASVLENQPADTFVTQVKATDEDGDGVVYSLVGGSGLHLFRMDNEGTIRTAVTFDRETQEHYWLQIVAKDTAAVPKYSVLHCYVKIGDVNDNSPMTVEPIYYTSVPENSPPDTVVAKLEAFDPDSVSSQLTYKISAGNPQGFFTIHEKTGVIRTTNRKFDRETQSEHTLEITISDNGEPTGLFSTTHVVVSVQDVQDSAVAFLKEHVQRYQVPAWKPPSTLPLFRIIAFDTDIGTNADIRFGLVGKKTENDRYRIDPKTGEVFALQALSIGEDYVVMVKASDPEDSAPKKTLRIMIEALPIPPSTTQPPKIARSFMAQVLETDPVGHMVILLEAEDPDGDYLWYHIIDGDPDKQFHIGPSSGSLIVARPLDWETRRNYTLRVNVTDGVHFVSTIVVIRVVDVNEHRPQFIKRTFTASVTENALPGTEVVRVAASDMDEEQRLLFSIYATGSPSSQSKFHIDENTGVLTTTESLDRETVAHHIVIIAVKDRGSLSRGDLAKVLVNVIDLNDHAPVFKDIVQPVIVQHDSLPGTAITTIQASDRDKGLNAEISYRLIASHSLFEIDSVTGVVKLLQPASAIGTDENAVKIEATDRGVPPLKSETLILIKLAEQTANRFAFKDDNLTAFVAENLPPGTFVAAVPVEYQSFVTYELTDRQSGGKQTFVVDSTSGVVSTSVSLDFEQQRKYVVTITATNEMKETASATLTIYVKDVNDNIPKLNFSSIVGLVSESVIVGSSVLDTSGRSLILAAWDADEGQNRLLTFEILDADAQQYFTIASSGSVFVRKELDYEKQRQFQFYVKVADGGQPRLVSAEVAKVTIEVLNINDCAPVFPVREFNFSLTNPVLPNMLVGAVNANDPDDVDKTSALTYKITSGNFDKVFSLDPTSGILRLAQTLNNSAAIQENRSLVVQASDGLNSAAVSVHVSVSEVENNGLRFSRPRYEVNISENEAVGREILTLSLIGRYLNENIKFRFLSEHPAFRVDPTTGAFFGTGAPLDREVTSNISVVLEAASISQQIHRIARTEVFVTVLDVNDNAPRFTAVSYHAAVPIFSTKDAIVETVHATDDDEGENSVITYTMVSGDSSLFGVNLTTGVVRLLQDLSETSLGGKTFMLKIQATDRATTPLLAVVSVEVRIVSNHVPVFTQRSYVAQISEAAQIGLPVGTAEAFFSLNTTSETGIPVVRDVVYTITSGNPFNNFDIDFLTGIIRLSESIDYEVQKQYVLQVRAMDQAKWETLFSDVTFVVDVLDANDNAPKAKDGVTFHTIKISESTIPGTEIFQASAADADSGENAQLFYTLQWSDAAAREVHKRIHSRRKSEEEIFFRCGIQQGVSGVQDFKAGDYFHIDPTSGKVYLTNALDREMIDQLDLTIIISDFGHPRQSASMTLRVLVKDINDNPPCFSQLSYDFVVSDGIYPGKFVGAVASVDQDEDPEITYDIVNGDEAGLFAVDKQGIVRYSDLARGFLQSTMQMNLTASDGVHVSYTVINILPIIFNRNRPKFDWPFYALSIAENVPVGSFVGSVLAKDRDIGRNGQLRYSIVGDYFDDLFAVDAEKGSLNVVGVLDRERKPYFLFWVQVSDMGGLTDFCQVNLTVNDVNDEPPVFTRSIYRATIFPNSSSDATILKVEATDQDLRENGSVTYSIKKGSLERPNRFYLDPKAGTLHLKKPLKLDENTVTNFVIEARDMGVPSMMSSVPVELLVVTDKSVLPEFAQLLYHISIHEGSPLNTTILHIRMKRSESVLYNVIPPVFSGEASNNTLPFTINNDGRLMVSGLLDAEKQNEYRFFVAATLHSNPLVVNHAEMRVKIIDENDNAPMFVADKFTVSAPENYTGDSLRLLPIVAIDLDQGSNAEIRYELTGQSDSPFELDSKTGWLTLKRKLDREAEQRFVLEVKATDSGFPPQSSTTTVEVQVMDINDNPPYFAQPRYQASVQEESIPDTPITIIQATDADQTSALEYCIVKGDPYHHFIINSRGEVFVVTPLDREKLSSYDLTILASDGLGTATTILRVTVIDVNDNTPVCNKSMFREIVPEDIDIGHVILRLQASDSDEQNELDYSIVGEGSQAFSIDRSTGILRVRQNLDRESQDLFSLLGIAADRDGRSCTASIEIVITDVNDMAPAFHENLTVNVLEGTPPDTLVYRLRARDDDLGNNRLVKYSLLPSDQSHPDNIRLFAVGDTSGFVRLIGEVDRENTSRYDLRIRAKDYGSPSLWSMASLKVSILNVRDDPPVFKSQHYEVTIPENLKIGDEVLAVEATSLDDAVKDDITYRIMDGNQLGFFDIRPTTGKITLNKTLDFEKQTEYIVFVEARDSSDPPLSGSSQVTIKVSDVNDNAPVWTQSIYAMKIHENTLVGSQILQVSASDIDTGANGKVEYQLDNSEDIPFLIDRNTGLVSVASVLDREAISSYTMTVRAMDCGTPVLGVVASIEISLLDVNDNAPVFDKANYSAVLQEKRPEGFTMMRFTIMDSDAEPNGGPFSLEIRSGNAEGLFQISSSDLSLRTTKSLESRLNSEFHLVIRAKDHGDPELWSEASVVVRVVEESQFPPKMGPMQISILSADGNYVGGVIGRVTATDPDIYDSLRYDIVSPETRSLFELDATQGTLSAKAGIETGQYDLNVSVTDGRFTTYEKVMVTILEVGYELLENSVSLKLDDVSVEEFINSYRRDFIRALRQLFSLRRTKDVHVISVQPAESDGDEVVDRKKREVNDFNNSIEVLFAVWKGKNGGGYQTADHIRQVLDTQSRAFENIVRLKILRSTLESCTKESCAFGTCKNQVKLLDSWEAPYVSVIGNNGQSYVFPRHRLEMQCTCRSGYTGVRCEKMNECATTKCDPPKVCMVYTYMHGKNEAKCVCPNGKEDARCEKLLAGDSDDDAMSFNGHSYAWYDLQKPIERHLSLSMKFKTRHGAGNLMYVAGRLDYSILEIKHGVVQYRFDCGSGEGIARLEGVFVSDNKWHELSIQRHGRQAEIRLDGKYTAHATAPGINDILNLEGNDAFFGAEVPGRYSSSHTPTQDTAQQDTRRGFIGCLKNIQLNGVELPRIGRNPEATLVRLTNIQWGCHILAGELGPCASMPCQNGAACEPTTRGSFSCRCPPRFSGILCENDSNPCANSPCLHGHCTNRPSNDFHCACPVGLTGKRCEYGRYCNPNPCVNGGCEEGTYGAICQCLSGFEGAACERDVDECQQTPCLNGGTCQNLLGGFRCNCTVQARGTLCEEVMYIPTMSGLTPGWGWIEILIILVVIVLLTSVGVCGVLCCRRRHRKRRTGRLEPASMEASPSAQINNNVKTYDELNRNNFSRTRVAPDDFLLKRGSKISNLEVESRQPFLNSDQISSSLNMYRSAKGRYRNQLTPPPPSFSGTSSETVSVKKDPFEDVDGHDHTADMVKACIVDLPTTPRQSTSVPNISKNVKKTRDYHNTDTLNSRSNGSSASVATSPMNSDDGLEDTGVSGLNGESKAYFWDPTGTGLESAGNSVETATETASVDGQERCALRESSYCESPCFAEDEFEEDGMLEDTPFFVSVQPPEPFQDQSLNKYQIVDHDEDKIMDNHVTSTISKRFSDYIPTAEVDGSTDDSRENVAKTSVHAQLATADSDLDLQYDVAIPPPMPDLEGYASFNTKRVQGLKDYGRRFVSNEALSSHGFKEANPETVSLLNGHGNTDKVSGPRSVSNGHGLEHQVTPVVFKPFSSALGKQTQV